MRIRNVGIWISAACMAMFAAGLAALASADIGKLPFTLTRLAPGVYAAIAVPGASAGANAGFVIGEEAVAVIDTFVSATAAEALLAEIRRLTPLPVRYVINTHHHIDHVAGNAVFLQQGAVLIAQRNVRNWVKSENLRLFGDRITAEREAQVKALEPPRLGYEGELLLDLGGVRIVVRSLPGHTGGDSIVRVPKASVAFLGDLFWRRSVPNLVDATVADWVGTLERITQGPSAASMRFVPGHGEIGSGAEVLEFRAYLLDLRAAVGTHRKDGLGGNALHSAVLAQLAARYGDWAYYKSLAPRNVLDMAAELEGRKRNPPLD